MMESDGSEVDDLADIELSNFALPGQHPSDDYPLNVWNNDTIGSTPMEMIADAEKTPIPPSNDTLMGTDLLDLTDITGESGIDQSQSHSMESGSRSGDSSYDWNAGNSTNPFQKSTNDLQMAAPSPNNPFRENNNISTVSSTSELNNNPFGSSLPGLLLQPSNPFIEQSPNNPFRSLPSQIDDTCNVEPFNFDNLNTPGPTEYVYMSRLPGENIGMVLGIDGDQENRKPITAVHVKSITPGGAAARACQGNNRIEVGDEIREIDGKSLNQLTHDECITLLQEMPDTVVLTIYRREKQDPVVNKEYDPQLGDEENVRPSQCRTAYDPQADLLLDRSVSITTIVSGSNSSVEHPKDISSDLSHIPKGFNSFVVTIFREERDSLGISIVPSYGATCDLYQIKRLLPGGACAKVQRLEIGDRLLACNGHSLRGLGQTQCLQVLKSSGLVVDLTVLRPVGKETSVANVNYNSSFLVSNARQAGLSRDVLLNNSADISTSSVQEEQVLSPFEEINHSESESDHRDVIPGYGVDNSYRSDLISDFEISESNPRTVELLCGHKEEFPNQGDGLIYPQEENLVDIPPPVEFSDLTSKENISFDKTADVSSKYVTNIDDLLFLDIQSETSQSNPFVVESFTVDRNDELLETTPPQHSVHQDLDDDSINLGSRSIEEFAEKCFESITDQITSDNATASNSKHAGDFSCVQNSSEHEEWNSNSLSTTVPWDLTSDSTDNKAGSHVTVFPVSSHPQKFISTIPVQAPNNVSENISKPVILTESHPFTSVIQITSTGPSTNVTKIDVLSSPKTDTQLSPSFKTDTRYPGSIVFHTHVEDNLHVHRSTTISLDGESTAVTTMNGYQEDSSLANGLPVAHTTVGISSTAVTGEEEELIRPMLAAKDCQGKLHCVVSATENNSLSSVQDSKIWNSSNISGLADTLARHGSHNVEPVHSEEFNETVAEDEIVPTVMSRDDKEVVMNVLNKWQHSAATDKSTLFQNTVDKLIHSGDQPNSYTSNSFSNSSVLVHSTLGIQTKGDKGAEEEEHIVPMAAAKDQQGKPLYTPATMRSPVVETEKDLTGLLNIANIMADNHGAADHSSGTSDHKGIRDGYNAEEEKVVPTILSKDQTEMVKGVLDIWNSGETTNKPSPVEKAAVGFMHGLQDTVVHTTLGVSCSARSGEEEELIQPMAASKDFQGKPLYMPSKPRTFSPVKEKDVSGLVNIASTMADYHSFEKRSPKEEAAYSEDVSEETIVPTRLSKAQAETVENVIANWKGDNDIRPNSVQKAALGFMQSANLVPTGGISHTTLGVSSKALSGEEEELIHPMNVAKDIQGKPIWVQPSLLQPVHQQEKFLNECALQNFAKALESSSITASTPADSSSDEEISEETIKPVAMTSDQKEIISSVINKWSTIVENQPLMRKAVSRFKAESHMEQNVDMPDSKSVVHVNSQNGRTASDNRDIFIHHDGSERQGTKISLNTSDVISQSKSSSGQKSSYRDAVNIFKNVENKSTEVSSQEVVLRSKPRSSANFKAKLEGFQKQDSSSLSSSSSSSSSLTPVSNVRFGRPKSMSVFEISSSKTSYGLRPTGNTSSTYKPLSTIKTLGPSIAQKRASLALGEKSSTVLQGSSLLQQAPRSDYPKTRQDDGRPFQQDVLAGIVGLGLKVKMTDGYAVITDIQRSGPLGKSGNVKVGDFLLAVNGKELTGQTDARVQQTLRLLTRGLIKLVVSGKKPQDIDTPKSSADTNGDLLPSNTFADEEAPSLPASSAPVTTTSFIASANGIQPIASHGKSSHLTDFNLPISTSASELPQNDDQQPPITARIEISPGNQKGAPMKIAIKPTTTPRHLPGVITRPTPMPRYPYASSTNESWETSSEDSTPREPGHIIGQKMSSASIIASQRKPAGGEVFEEPAMTDSNKFKDFDHKVTASQPSPSHNASKQNTIPIQDVIVQEAVQNVSSGPKTITFIASERKSDGGEVYEESATTDIDKVKDSDHTVATTQLSPSHDVSEQKAMPFQDAIVQATVHNVSSAPKSQSLETPRKVPPPVAPKPRLSSSSPTKADNTNEKGDQQVEKKTAKISAGYERLQALAKAKPAKPSRVIEKSRAFVSSTAKFFDDKAGDGNESPKHVSSGTSSKVEVNRLNSSLLPLNKRRQSTGSTPLLSSSYSSSLSRPKTLSSKFHVPSAVAIPEATSPRHDDIPGGKAVKSPTNMNSALSPRRASSVETPSPLVFKFSQKTAPKIDSSTEGREGKVLNSALSPHSTKDKFGVHKLNSSPASHEFASHSQPVSKNDSKSPVDDKPLSKSFTSRNRSKSSSSLMPSQSTVLTSPMNDNALEDTMKKFDDLLIDAPYAHTETDPAELLLWTPVRKDSSTVPTSSQKTKLDLQPTTAITKQEPGKPVAPPRRKPPVPKSDLEEFSSVNKSSLDLPSSSDHGVESNLLASETSLHLEAPQEPEFAKSNKDIVNKPELDWSAESVLMKEPEISLSDKRIVVEDVLTSSSQVDSESSPRISKLEVRHKLCDYGNMIDRPSFNENENIPAFSLAKEMLEEKADELQEQMSDTPKTAYEAQRVTQNIDNSYSQIAEMSKENDTLEVVVETKHSGSSQSHKYVHNMENSLLTKDLDNDLNQNIPALLLASNMTEEHKATSHEEISDLNNEEESLSFRQDEASKLIPDSTENNDGFLKHAKQIVNGVFEKISQDPDSFLQRESKEYRETASPASSEDEPPPLPGAPPPPIIFRQNSTLLTEREWLEDDGDVTNSQSSANSGKISVAPGDSRESKPEPNELLSSSSVTAVEKKDDESRNADMRKTLNTEPFFEETLESQMRHLSSDRGDLALNIVGQNTALAMKQDHSLDEEEGHSRSDSLEPLNSTGDSCHEACALRVSSPNSVDVLSEDSGMPADEEFQEVNTDDTISPSSELRDFVQTEITKTVDVLEKSHKAEDLQSSPELITLHDSKTFTDVVNNDLDVEDDAQESHSPPPMLPTSAPPDFLAPSELSYNSETDTLSVPQAQSSDSQPSSKEAFLDGDETPVSAVVSTTTFEAAPTNEKAIPSKGQIVNTSVNVQPQAVVINKSNLQHEEQEDDVVQVMETIVEEKDNSASNVLSERKWTLFSNQSGPGCVINGQPGSTTQVSFTEETLSSSFPTSEFISVIAKANETLNTLKAPQDTEILIVHLHREGNSVPLGIELKLDKEFWYKVSTIRSNSPAAQQGAIENGDFLIAVDNLLCTQCSLMRCMARITKPKHNSILVLARTNSQLVTEETSSSPKPKCDGQAAQGESQMPVVATRSSHSKIPPIRPRQSTSPTSKTAPPLSPPPTLPEKEASASTSVEFTPAASTPSAVGQAETQSKEGSTNSKPVSSQGPGLYDVIMMKGVTGVGFCLEGGVGSPKGDVPISIKRIFKGGPAEKCGQLQVKDQILEVNGISFTAMRHYEAWNHLKFLDDGEVHLKIRRPE